jgi:hypothetical protein
MQTFPNFNQIGQHFEFLRLVAPATEIGWLCFTAAYSQALVNECEYRIRNWLHPALVDRTDALPPVPWVTSARLNPEVPLAKAIISKGSRSIGIHAERWPTSNDPTGDDVCTDRVHERQLTLRMCAVVLTGSSGSRTWAGLDEVFFEATG